MAPELVIADAPFKKYPGGVVAFRCTDWMAGARGSLSSESDAFAVTGECVRDSQQVTGDLFGYPSYVDAWTDALPTLEIDMAGALEEDMHYEVFVSMRAEGLFDPTDYTTYRNATAEHAGNGYEVIMFGAADGPDVGDSQTVVNKPYRRAHYTLQWVGGTGYMVGDEILTIKAFAMNGATYEILLDQVILMPRVYSNNHGPGSSWDPDDFQPWIEGAAGSYQGSDLVDGADGGDDFGRFTYDYFADVCNEGWLESPGGDYQRKEDGDDAEFNQQNEATDGYYYIEDSTKSWPDNEPAGIHAYSMVGVNYREAETVCSDTFTRTRAETEGWGQEEANSYTWHASEIDFPASSLYTPVDGGVGIQQVRGTIGGPTSVHRSSLFSGWGPTVGTLVDLRDFMFSGRFKLFTTPSDIGSPYPDDGWIWVSTRPYVSPRLPGAALWFRLVEKTWYFGDPNGPDYTSYPLVTGDESAWFGFETWVRWKIEFRRYKCRFKLWQDGTTEPGWLYDDFLPIFDVTGPTIDPPIDYPYDEGDLAPGYPGSDWRRRAENVLEVGCWGRNVTTSIFDVGWDDILIEYDPGGDPAPMSVRLEKNGDTVGEMEIPYGAYQLVYWGKQDLTDFVPGDGSYLDFEIRVWNDPDAAELQRADINLSWFRSVHGGGIVSMNWRSADRSGVAQRILVGR